jgi:hypothetical protein
MLPLRDVPLFRVTLFLSAALAFVIQPLIAKRLLPLLGGSPAVWNTCLLFFQATLLAGYALSYRLARLQPRTQVSTHLALLVLAGAAALYGWLAPLVEPTAGGSPTGWLLATLATTVGAPFLVLSVNSTLLQQWFDLSDVSGDPYSLYRASNLGSLLGLISFPFVFEPMMTLGTQATIWGAGFAALVVLVGLCGQAVWKRQSKAPEAADSAADDVNWARRAMWVAVAFVPSSLTIGVTTFISTDLAAVPLLWVIPLAVYLLSFALTFGPVPATRSIKTARWAFPVLAITVLAIFHRPTLVTTLTHLLLNPLLLFSVGVLAHGFLAADRPSSRRLTEFYLWVALGGVLGGVFNALVAPVIFNRIIEYPIVIAAAAFILPLAWNGARGTSLVDVAVGIGVGLMALATTAVVQQTMSYGAHGLFVIFILPLIVCLMVRDRWLRFGTAVTAVLLMTNILPGASGRVLYETRTFFGTMRVTADRGGAFHTLRHGTTTHGRQDRRGALRRKLPLSYYHVQGPIGQLVGKQRTWKRPLRVGVVGLGTGTMAAYAESGDHFVFYEIDREVVRIAETPAWFSYLSESAVRPRIVLGDARLSLAHAKPENFDLLLLDAFSSDSIPVHLVTREAFEIYKRHLSRDGLVITHVSNRHLEIGPTIAAIARSVGLDAVEQGSVVTPEVAAQGYAASRWVAAGTREAFRANGLPTDSWRVAPQTQTRPWSDDYSNLAGVIVWQRSLREE